MDGYCGSLPRIFCFSLKIIHFRYANYIFSWSIGNDSYKGS